MVTMPSFWLEHEENGQTRDFSFNSTTVSIGRDKACDFVLDHPTVSRKHAVIAYKHGSFYLVVLSRSGLTAIDGQPVQGEVLLYDSSNLNLGQLQFRFRSDDAPVKPVISAHAGHIAAGAMHAGAGLSSGFGAAVRTPAPHGDFGGAPMGGQRGLGHGGGFGAAAPPAQPQGLNQPQGFGGFGGPLPTDMGPSVPLNSHAQFSASQQSSAASAPSTPVGDAGVSWDQIANSSEAMLDASGQRPLTVHERLQGTKGEEKTNPLIIVVAGLAIVGLMYFTFFSGGGDAQQVDVEMIPMDEQVPVEITVTCLGESACMQKAEAAYRIGKEKIQQKTVAIPNLFEGYKKLLEAEEYLVKAGNVAAPASMAGLAGLKQTSRAELDRIWVNYRVGFAKAKKRNEYREMANELNALRNYFPDRTARENRWSVRQAQKMKEDGIYPKGY